MTELIVSFAVVLFLVPTIMGVLGTDKKLG
jgi:hypothetical protein